MFQVEAAAIDAEATAPTAVAAVSIIMVIEAAGCMPTVRRGFNKRQNSKILEYRRPSFKTNDRRITNAEDRKIR